MIWLGYFFTVLNYACYCLNRFMKHNLMFLISIVFEFLPIVANEPECLGAC